VTGTAAKQSEQTVASCIQQTTVISTLTLVHVLSHTTFFSEFF